MKRTVSLLSLAVVSGNLILAASSKLSPELSARMSTTAKVVIQYKQAPAAADFSLLSLLGGVMSAPLSSLHFGIATMPVTNLQALSNNPNVTYISPDRPLSQLVDYSTSAVNASAAWNSGLTGSGIGVAVIDSGISPVARSGSFWVITKGGIPAELQRRRGSRR